MDKVEFQKFVKKYRINGKEFPKAMMHHSQIRKRTATINCGYSDISIEIVSRLVSSEFNDFLASQKARYVIEETKDLAGRISKQIRIYW